MNIPDCKVYVEDGNQEAFQEKVFRLGGQWQNGKTEFISEMGNYFFIEGGGKLTHSNGQPLYFIKKNLPQIHYEDFMALPEPKPELTHDQILDNYWFRSDNGIWGRFFFYNASKKAYQRISGGTLFTKEEILRNFEYSPTKPEE